MTESREELDAMTRGEAYVTPLSDADLAVNVEWTITFTAASRKTAADIIHQTEGRLIELVGTRHVPAIPVIDRQAGV